MEKSGAPEESRTAEPMPWLPYVAPMAVFLVMTSLVEPRFPHLYVWLYIAKACLVTGALFAFRGPLKDIRSEPRALLPAVLVGLAVYAFWIPLDRVTFHPAFLGSRAAFNPFINVPDAHTRFVFLAVRFYGLAVMVPIMEEVFWRSFLLRFFTKEDFKSLPIGAFSWGAFALVAAGFGLAHPEWLSAILCACAYGLLLRQTRSLSACVIAHGVTNLALGIHVMVMHSWIYW